MLVQLLLIFLLGLLAFQDFRSREVSVFLFPVITILFLWVHVKASHGVDIKSSVLLCCLFVLVQLGLLGAYFLLRQGSLRFLSASLGLGDVFFLGCLCFLFSPVNYIAFHLISLLSGLAFAFCTKIFSKSSNISIPLAGLQACLVIAIMLYSLLVKPVAYYSDQYLFARLSQ